MERVTEAHINKIQEAHKKQETGKSKAISWKADLTVRYSKANNKDTEKAGLRSYNIREGGGNVFNFFP